MGLFQNKTALTFFYKAFANNGIPEKVTIDKSGANIAALDQINDDYINCGEITRIEKRCSKYLNNRIEQDHRFIKRRTNPMLGFKSFSSAINTLTGLELMRIIQKKQVINGRGLSNWQIFKSLAA
ncbi:DDE-type integrase/transposase/recombinase [Plebeiibacterium sediminum]|uniref:DDE-type integrase/transposase/recombinase n=1 Tax=Plebeiibacterium sediminum TaxID=2992112 RepID=A0AAE3M6H1_9BACT|nr:DDE-type integrase/transposase/recombinase [Plebeiobacterium sediminum]MCW3787973.1 DDE-type integrase/transposase/recombinase [Plebeiobacterium sediminum]